MKSRKQASRAAAESPTSASGNPGPRPTVEEIRLRAYQIYIEHGRTDGQDLEDWLQAEKELTGPAATIYPDFNGLAIRPAQL